MAQRYQQGCVEVIQFDERLTIDEVDQVRPALFAALDARMPQAIIDLRRVRIIDSAGLELLAEAREHCVRRRGAVRLAGASPLVRDVLRVTGLDQQFAAYPDVVTAAGTFAL